MGSDLVAHCEFLEKNAGDVVSAGSSGWPRASLSSSSRVPAWS